jgi:hypothetical protein
MVALLVVGTCRGAYVNLWLVGGGQSLTSPSMRYSAHAVSYNGKTFFGGTKRWSHLWVVDGLGRTIWETEVYSDLEIEWRTDGAVTWAPDSSGVVFTAVQENGASVEIHSAAFPAGPSVEEIIDDLERSQE